MCLKNACAGPDAPYPAAAFSSMQGFRGLYGSLHPAVAQQRRLKKYKEGYRMVRGYVLTEDISQI